MTRPGLPTFDQLAIFLAVIEAGSFAGAARNLGRAVSVIHYGIANLEAQLGLPLFERRSTRRPVLTPAGRALLADARAIAASVDGLLAKVEGLQGGLEGEVAIAVDVMLPHARLARVLREFAERFPSVHLRLYVEALGAITALVRDGEARLGLTGPLALGGEELDTLAAGSTRMVPVCAPSHPLARMATIAPGAARDHVQLVLSDRSTLTAGQDFAVLSPKTWRLADLSAKHALLREGVGWGNMPLPMVRADLASGALVRLALPEAGCLHYPFALIWRRDSPPGIAGTWMRDRLADLGSADQSSADA